MDYNSILSAAELAEYCFTLSIAKQATKAASRSLISAHVFHTIVWC